MIGKGIKPKLLFFLNYFLFFLLLFKKQNIKKKKNVSILLVNNQINEKNSGASWNQVGKKKKGITSYVRSSQNCDIHILKKVLDCVEYKIVLN